MAKIISELTGHQVEFIHYADISDLAEKQNRKLPDVIPAIAFSRSYLRKVDEYDNFLKR